MCSFEAGMCSFRGGYVQDRGEYVQFRGGYVKKKKSMILMATYVSARSPRAAHALRSDQNMQNSGLPSASYRLHSNAPTNLIKWASGQGGLKASFI